MNKRIYVCHTYYHVYVSFLKEMNLPKEERQNATLLLSLMTTDFRNIKERIEASQVFEKVMFFDEKRDSFFPELAPYMNMTGNQFKILLGRIKYTKLYGKLEEAFIPVDFRQYNDIYVFCDSDPIGFYLNYKKIKYHAVEDGLNTLLHCDSARYRNQRFFPLKAFLSSKLNLLFIQNGYGKYCIDMEVNDISCLKYKHKKYIEVSRKALVDNLDRNQIELLLTVFISNIKEIKALKGSKHTVLLLTEPLCDLTTRSQIFKDICSMYSEYDSIVIKPHPADLLNYHELFPNCIVIDRTVPMEILNFIEGLSFDVAVAVFTELSSVSFAKTTIRLGADFMDAYEDPSIHRYNDNI